MGARRLTAALAVALGAGTLALGPHALAQDGDGCVMWGTICVPPEAERIIDSVPRTPASNNHRLVDGLAELEAMGVPREEVMRAGLGRFPVAGRASYVHDWLYPRFGPGFRFHQGTDVFADHGTPLQSPVDGVATSATGGLGGLTVRITMPDGTYFYLAHLSALVEGFEQGMQVSVGDVVGYVGDSGNARGGAPHLHLGIYPKGGPAIDPKPILDRFLAEAEARLPAVIEAYRDAYGVDGPPVTAPPPTEPPPVSPLAPDGVPVGEGAGLDADPGDGAERIDLAAGTGRDAREEHGEAAGEPLATAAVATTPVLFVAGANPAVGALSLLEAEIADVTAAIDWEARSSQRSPSRHPRPSSLRGR